MSLDPSLNPEPRASHVAELASGIRRLEDARRLLATRLDVPEACASLLTTMVDATDASRGGLDLEHHGRRISDWVLRERRPLLLDGEVKDQRFDGSAPVVESAICLPLLGKAGPIGVLNLARVSPAQRFAQADLATGEHLARALAATLDEMMVREAAESSWSRLSRGTSAVRRIAPGLFQSLSYQVALARIPSPLLSGDVAERLVHGDGSQTVMVADVAGSSAEALAAGSLLQGLFLGFARASRSPAEIAWRINSELCQRLAGGSFATLWIANLSASGRMISCNAGFPPPTLVPMEGDHIRSFDVGGPLAGVLPEAEYEEQSLRLLPGDAVVAVSDGLLSACNAAGHEFGPGRVEEIAVEQRRQPLDRLAEALCAAALEHGAAALPVDEFLVFAVRYSRDS